MRDAIRTALPDAEEIISYTMPAYKVDDQVVLYFAGWKQHYSLYPAGKYLLETLKDQLAPYKVYKGTIRFALSEPSPVKLIERIATLRAKEVAMREHLKHPVRKLFGIHHSKSTKFSLWRSIYTRIFSSKPVGRDEDLDSIS